MKFMAPGGSKAATPKVGSSPKPPSYSTAKPTRGTGVRAIAYTPPQSATAVVRPRGPVAVQPVSSKNRGYFDQFPDYQEPGSQGESGGSVPTDPNIPTQYEAATKPKKKGGLVHWWDIWGDVDPTTIYAEGTPETAQLTPTPVYGGSSFGGMSSGGSYYGGGSYDDDDGIDATPRPVAARPPQVPTPSSPVLPIAVGAGALLALALWKGWI